MFYLIKIKKLIKLKKKNSLKIIINLETLDA